jgi:hypothetical protein
MRSEQVFRAYQTLGNRYLLCRATATVTRCLHFVSANTHEAINDAFSRVANEPNLLDQSPRASISRYVFSTARTLEESGGQISNVSSVRAPEALIEPLAY